MVKLEVASVTLIINGEVYNVKLTDRYSGGNSKPLTVKSQLINWESGTARLHAWGDWSEFDLCPSNYTEPTRFGKSLGPVSIIKNFKTTEFIVPDEDVLKFSY